MIHPDTILKTASPLIGCGVFATDFISRGTIVVVRDSFDIVLTQKEYETLPCATRQYMETYLYHDKHGNLVLSWDHARYMNHSCRSNTMMTDYGFEIAVRDIRPGEEVTSEYGLLNIQEPYRLHCNCSGCRGHLRRDDIDKYGDIWDELVKQSLLMIFNTPQPLIELLPPETLRMIRDIPANQAAYSSVKNLKWRKEAV